MIVPKPQNLEYPGLLDLEKPKISTYSLESVIAEKFEAMLRLSTINSRMKNFYNLYVISSLKSFDGRVLQEAISSTLERRGTPLEEDPIIFKKEFATNKQRLSRWNGYLNRIGKSKVAFLKVMMRLEMFLLPIYKKIIEEEEFLKYWNSNQYKWDKYRSDQ